MKMIELIKSIENLESLNFRGHLDNNNNFSVSIDTYEFGVYNVCNKIEQYLRGLAIKGQTNKILNIKNQLLGVRDVLTSVDYGINFKIMNNGQQIKVEPETVKQATTIKIRYVTKLLEYIETIDIDQVRGTEQLEPLDITKASHKILVLYELGILDHLRKKYSVLAIDSDTNLGHLLAALLGDNYETVRAALKNLNPRTTRTIINKTSVRKVKAELIKLGIETKTLPDL